MHEMKDQIERVARVANTTNSLINSLQAEVGKNSHKVMFKIS